VSASNNTLLVRPAETDVSTLCAVSGWSVSITEAACVPASHMHM
jgi:hypothetical protein